LPDDFARDDAMLAKALGRTPGGRKDLPNQTSDRKPAGAGDARDRSEPLSRAWPAPKKADAAGTRKRRTGEAQTANPPTAKPTRGRAEKHTYVGGETGTGRRQSEPPQHPAPNRAGVRDASSPPAPWSPSSGTAPSALRDPHAMREAEKYAEPIPSREALSEFLGASGELMTAQRLSEALGLESPERFEALSRRLAAMLRDGQLLMNRRGGYGVAEKLDLIAGEVIAHPDGFGFLRTDAGGDDLFLPPGQMRRVLHGDRVLASVTGVDRRGRREGAIVEVLERRTTRLVGRFEDSDGVTLVVPDDKRLHRSVLIPPALRGNARQGQIVVVELTSPPSGDRPPLGRVASVLGERLSASLTVRMAIESHGLPHEWPPDVLEEASAASPFVTEAEREGRVDLRATPLVTIDGEDARDFDDAVWCEKVAGGFRLLVAIADVSHYVQPGGALDREAQDRATSVYFPEFVVPMLPEVLSNGICSLNPDVERLCMVCDVHVDANGGTSQAKFYPAVMRSHARLTYTEVWAAIGERDADTRTRLAHVLPQLDQLNELFKVLAKARTARGAIEFESSEFKFRLGAGGEVLAVGAYERNDAHRLIEECMIAANVEAARFIQRTQVPAPFRVHAPPPEAKFADLLEYLREFGLRLPAFGEVKPLDFAHLLRRVRERPDASLIESVVLRSQSMAVYTPDNHGHFGLALDAYSHFTSPIRRYPDLLLHRAIRHAIARGTPATYRYSVSDMAHLTSHCSRNERRADEAERDVDERFKCAWMEKHVGSEFDGVISGVTTFGLFVELKPTRVSGLVHITQLPNDYYHFDPKRHLLTGERRGLIFRIGQPVRVQVLRASIEDRKIDFRLISAEGTAVPSPHDFSSPPRKQAIGRRR